VDDRADLRVAGECGEEGSYALSVAFAKISVKFPTGW